MAEVLGRKVRDKVTGFTGIATAITERLHGGTRICIEGPVDKEGKAVPDQWFEEARVVAIDGQQPLSVGFRRPEVVVDPPSERQG